MGSAVQAEIPGATIVSSSSNLYYLLSSNLYYLLYVQEIVLYQCLWTKLANKKVGVGAVKEINVLITPNCRRRSTHWSGGDIGILAEQD